ncbi:MAG: NAD(+) diphosphatase [Solirubrobacteraceae bacterium]
MTQAWVLGQRALREARRTPEALLPADNPTNPGMGARHGYRPTRPVWHSLPVVPLTTALSGARLDRAEDGRRRDVDWVAAQLADPRARAVVVSDVGFRVEHDALSLIPLAEARPAPDTEPLLLGLDADGPVFVVDTGPPRTPPHPPPPAAMVAAGVKPGEPMAPGELGLREVGSLSQQDGGLAAYAAALVNWHRAHRFCANCGAKTVIGEAGVTRGCPTCHTDHHPRLDPCVITLVVDGERVLLGRQPSWPARRYSTLAGFVAPGETLEEAVVREVREEAGVEVGTPSYRGSQPWPFPASLMLGFTALYISGDINPADEELEDAAWFDRDRVAAAAHDDSAWESVVDGDGLLLPPRSSIARQLIEEWLSGQ